jgi:hypothetical protein
MTAPLAAEARRDGYRLAYDDELWVERQPTPPADLVLDCVGKGCAVPARLTTIRDARPLPAPGAGPFTPGAASAAVVALRAQRLTPGGRLRAGTGAVPVRVGATAGYAEAFEIEDRNLSATALAVALVPLNGETLQIRLISPGGRDATMALLLSLLPNVTQDRATP